jgi:anti-sigma B factor antagonist
LPAPPSGLPQFEVAIHDDGTTRTVTPHGELDLASVPRVAKPLVDGLTEGFDTVVLDLSATTFIDSTGVSVVVGATARARERPTRFVVIPGPAEVHRVFALCGLLELVPFSASAVHGAPAD